MIRWTTSRAGAAILVLAACSPGRSEVADAGIGVPGDAPAGSNDAPGDVTASPDDATGSPSDAATSSNDAGNDVPLVDSACGDSARPRDAASAPTMPDPDDPSCLVPAPQPLACMPRCAPDESPVLHCERSQTDLISGAYGMLSRADSQGVYWIAEFGYLRMQRIGAPRGSYEELARVASGSFTFDDDAVYFSSPSDAGPVTLTRMKRDRTDRVALADVKPDSRYALDETSIYFNRVDGKVASVPKSGHTRRCRSRRSRRRQAASGRHPFLLGRIERHG
jgi:hypothetical protein